MRISTTVWTLSWDTDEGTDCEIFCEEKEWYSYFCKLIEASLPSENSNEASAIRQSLADGNIGAAYELWQESYKPESDTYNWGSREIVVEVALCSDTRG